MPNDVAINYMSTTVADYSKEKSTMEFNIAQFADNTAFTAAVAAFAARFADITDGLVQQRKYSLTDRVSNASSSDTASAREKKALIRYEDTVTFKIYTVAVPTFDDSAVTFILSTDFVDPTVAPMPDFITAFEALVVSPEGNPVNFLTMERVGRAN